LAIAAIGAYNHAMLNEVVLRQACMLGGWKAILDFDSYLWVRLRWSSSRLFRSFCWRGKAASGGLETRSPARFWLGLLQLWACAAGSRLRLPDQTARQPTKPLRWRLQWPSGAVLFAQHRGIGVFCLAEINYALYAR